MKLIATAIDIAAPPARVWQILTDFPAHAQWNPFIKSVSGRAEAGEKLRVHVQPPGGRGMVFKPTVLAADPERELRWKGKLLVPGIFDGEHSFRLEPTTTGTRFHHGEKFSGIIVAMMGESSFVPLREGFEAMNAAIKTRAED